MRGKKGRDEKGKGRDEREEGNGREGGKGQM